MELFICQLEYRSHGSGQIHIDLHERDGVANVVLFYNRENIIRNGDDLSFFDH